MYQLIIISILFLVYESGAGYFVIADPALSLDFAQDAQLAHDGTAADIVARMARLRKLLQDDSYINRINDLTIECLSDNTSHSREFCEDVSYVDAVHTALRAASTKDSAPEEAVPEVSLQSSTAYPNLFRNFLVPNKPFKGKLDMLIAPSLPDRIQEDFDASATLAGCIRELGLKVDGEMRDLPYRVCSSKRPDYFEGAKIPRIASNNYIFRLASSAHFSPSLEEMGLLNYVTHWPSLMPLYDVFPAVQSCPSSMHMLVWGAPMDIETRIIHQSSQFALKPHIGRIVPHYIGFEGSGFPAAKDTPLLSGSYRDSVLGIDEYLFVPNGYVASFLPPPGSASIALSKMCFVDASNLKDFRASIAIEAVVSPRSKELVDVIDAIGFDIALSREPRPLEFPWLSGRVTDAHSATLTATDISVSTAPALPNLGDGLATRDRKNKGSALRDLNEAAQWASLAASLTLPVPGLPRFKTVGWRNATIEWETKNKPDRHDKTKFGFVLDICKANARDDCFKEIVEKAALKVRTLEVNGKPVHIFSTLLSKFIEPDTSYLARVTIFHGDAHGKPSMWSHVVRSMRLREPMAVLGPVEATLSPLETAPNGASESHTLVGVELRFAPAVDDGGMPIKSYVVYSKQHGPATYKGMISLGSFPFSMENGNVVVVARGVLVGVETEFFVAAVNELGVAPTSLSPSNIVKPVTRPSVFSIVRGMLDPAFALTAGTPSFPIDVKPSHKGDPSWSPSARYLRLRSKEQMLDLMEETSDRGEEVLMSLNVWSSHWNPEAVSTVEAQAAWMIPPHGDGPSAHNIMERNGQHDPEIKALVSRIAVVERGVVPFAKKIRKAQALGAVGVVIVDNGPCSHGAFDQLCVPGADKERKERFAALDYPDAWSFMRIPAVLVLADDWNRLLGRWGMSRAEAARLEIQQQEQRLASASGEL